MHSRESVEQELATLDFLETQIESAEQRLEAIMKVSVEADLLKSLPYVGKILSMVLMLEVGRVDRFPASAHLASYAGLVPRVHSSGGHTKMGQVCGNVNRNLKQPRDGQPTLARGNPRRAAVSADQTHQESSKSGGCRGAPLGRSSLVGTHQAGGLSRAAGHAASSLVDARVSAAITLTHEVE
jgi:hypothetical protein